MPNKMVNVIFQLGAAHLEFLDFLVGGKIDFLLDPVNLIIQSVIFVEHFSKMVVGAFEAPDDFAVFRELSKDRVMKVHGAVKRLRLIGSVQ